MNFSFRLRYERINVGLLFIIISNIFFSFSVKAQLNRKIDSLKVSITKSKLDTNQVFTLQQIAEEYSNIVEYDSAFKYTDIGLKLSRNLKYEKGIIIHLINSSGYYIRRQNQTKALELIFEAYKLAEEGNFQKETIQALTGISFAYTSFNNYREAIKYKYKQWKILETLISNREYRKNNFEKLNGDSLKISQAIATLSFYHIKINQLDSTFFYGKKAYAYACRIHKKDPSFLAYPINCIGFAYRLSGNKDSAMKLFRMSIQQTQLSTIKKNKITNLYKSYWEMAIIFKDLNQIDSSIYYAELALSYCKQLKWDKDAIEIEYLLAKNYSGINNSKALFYYEESAKLRDSLYNKEKAEQLANITFNEQERQKELEHQRFLAAEKRQKQIYFTIIGISVFLFVIVFIALSRSIITSEKVNTFLAGLAVMMIFKFWNMLTEPYVEFKISDNPAVLFFTAILSASALSPVQKPIKKWLKDRMLAKAKAKPEPKKKKKIVKKTEVNPEENQQSNQDLS